MDQRVVLVRPEDIERTLAIEPTQGKHLLPWRIVEYLKVELPFNILEDMDVDNEAEVHETEGDYWEGLEGEVTFVCGGRLINPRGVKAADGKVIEWKGTDIAGGKEYVLCAGGRLWIPSGVSHVHRKPKGVARLMITKILSQ